MLIASDTEDLLLRRIGRLSPIARGGKRSLFTVYKTASRSPSRRLVTVSGTRVSLISAEEAHARRLIAASKCRYQVIPFIAKMGSGAVDAARTAAQNFHRLRSHPPSRLDQPAPT